MVTKKANVSVQIRTQINASADKVWEVLGRQFADISAWTSIVETSEALSLEEIPPSKFAVAKNSPVKARRTQSINRGRRLTLVEVLTYYSDEKRVLKFYGVGLPSFIEFASDKQSIIQLGEKTCEVIFDIEIRLKGIFKLFKGLAKRRFSENFRKLQNDLKVFIESGGKL